MRFVKKQLPFLAKFLPKNSAKNIEEIEVVEEVHTGHDGTQEISHSSLDEDLPKAKWEELLEKQVPFIYKLVVKIKPKQKEVKPKASEATSGDAPKKKKIKPIHLLVGLILLYLFYDELTSEPEPEVVEAPPQEKVPNVNRPKKNPKAPNNPIVDDTDATQTPSEVHGPSVENPQGEETPTELDTPNIVEDDNSISGQMPNETVNSDNNENPTIDDPDTVTNNDETVDETIDDGVDSDATTQVLDNTPEVTDTNSSEGEDITPQPDLEPQEPISSDIYNTEQDITSSILESLEGKVKEQKKVDIEETLEPTEAPSYDYKGRGLVYNCQGGHWACIDDESYKSCSKNYGWNKAQGKEIECYASEVYASEEDCSRAQILKIDNVAKTNFCN